MSNTIMIPITFFKCYSTFKLILLSCQLQDTKLPRYKLQDNNIFSYNLQDRILLSCKLRDRNTAKMQAAK